MKQIDRETKSIIFFSLTSIILTFLTAWISFCISENIYPPFFEIWNRWDTRMYLDIAEKGFPYSDEGRRLITVLPLYPWLVRFASIFLKDVLLSALLISNLCYVVSLVFFYRLVKIDFSSRVAWRTIFYFSIFPTAYFLHAGYSESLFIMLIIISTYFARKDNWFLTSLFGMFATLTRINGVVLFPFLLFEYLQSKRFKFRLIKPNIYWLLLVLLGFLIYLFLNYRIFGTPFQFLISLKKYFWEEPSLPWHWVLRVAKRFSLIGPADWMIEGGMVISFWLFVLFTLFSYLKKIRFSYYFFLWLSFIFVSLTSTLSSLPRFMISFFPIFIIFAIWGRNPVKNFLLTFLFILLQGIFLGLFVREHWAF